MRLWPWKTKTITVTRDYHRRTVDFFDKLRITTDAILDAEEEAKALGYMPHGVQLVIWDNPLVKDGDDVMRLRIILKVRKP